MNAPVAGKLAGELARKDVANHFHPYTNLRAIEKDAPLIIVEGDGIEVIDDTGKRYIEGMAGLWCASLGFSEKRLADAAKRQMAKLPYYHSFSGKAHNVVAEVSAGSRAAWPAQKMKPSIAMAWLYGPMAAGAPVVWMASRVMGRSSVLAMHRA